MVLVERRTAARCDVVILDTRELDRPIAIVSLPLHLKAQTHGNWVDGARFEMQRRLLEDRGKPVCVSGKGALEPP